MILGHKNCGGVKALMSRTDVTKTTNDFIDKYVENRTGTLHLRPINPQR